VTSTWLDRLMAEAMERRLHDCTGDAFKHYARKTPRPCSVAGCDRHATGRGMCDRHREQSRRNLRTQALSGTPARE
jgi:hypothetical protein